MPTSSVSVILVNYRRADLTGRAVESLVAQPCVREIIVVDNAPLDDSCLEILQPFQPKIRLLKSDENLGFARACNRGAAVSHGDYLLFFNNDAKAAPDMVGELSRVLDENARVGIVGATVLNWNSDIIQNFTPTLDRWGFPFDAFAGCSVEALKDRDVADAFYVPGCSLMIRRGLFDALGGFDAEMFMFCEDADLCWRASLAGFDVVAAAKARCWHEGGGTAPAGVSHSGAYETSTTRIELREKNTIRMMIANLGPVSLLRYAILGLPAIVAECIVAFALGRRAIASAYAQAIMSSIARLPKDIERRRAVQRSRTRPDRTVLANLSRRYEKIHQLRRVGIPHLTGFVRQ